MTKDSDFLNLFGAAQMTLTLDGNSPPRALIGDALTFPIFDSFNTFPSGRIIVEGAEGFS